MPDSRANLQQFLHHIVQVSIPRPSAESVVQRAVQRIQFPVDGVRLWIWQENVLLHAGHGPLGLIVICVGPAHDGARDSRAEGARLRRT